MAAAVTAFSANPSGDELSDAWIEGDETVEVGAGGVALVPKDVPHEVENAGDGTLRFAAVYAGTDVVTTYEDEVQPDGSRERRPVE